MHQAINCSDLQLLFLLPSYLLDCLRLNLVALISRRLLREIPDKEDDNEIEGTQPAEPQESVTLSALTHAAGRWTSGWH